jgi:tRNA (guanine37-N1)-methyltransferase
MRIDVLTLFPEACEPFFSASILGRAQASGRVTICCHNIRDYAEDRHNTVDDRPFGGGPGMVMMCRPVFNAVESVEKLEAVKPTRILLTPQGERLDARIASELSECDRLLLIAGHYEGFDERIRLGLSPREISIGDYVLSGGEAAAMVLVDAVVRLVPGVLGESNGAADDSFALRQTASSPGDEASSDAGCLEYPQYTRPREFRGMTVPEVLLSGDHGRIRAWRMEEARRRTAQRRPDLLRTPHGREDSEKARREADEIGD